MKLIRMGGLGQKQLGYSVGSALNVRLQTSSSELGVSVPAGSLVAARAERKADAGGWLRLGRGCWPSERQLRHRGIEPRALAAQGQWDGQSVVVRPVHPSKSSGRPLL